MDARFAVGDGDDVVVDLAFFEIGVCALEFDVGCAVFEAAAVFEDFFEADACPAGGSYGAFAPL